MGMGTVPGRRQVRKNWKHIPISNLEMKFYIFLHHFQKRQASPMSEMTAKDELTFNGAEAEDYAKVGKIVVSNNETICIYIEKLITFQFKEQILPEIPFPAMKKEIALARFFRCMEHILNLMSYQP